MKKTIIAAIVTALSVTALTPTASAAPVRADITVSQPQANVQLVRSERRDGYRYGHRHHYLSERQIVRRLYRRGYDRPRVVGWHRGKYIVHAIGHRGKVRLVVSARSGHVLKRKLLRRHHHRHFRNHRSGFTLYFGGH